MSAETVMAAESMPVAEVAGEQAASGAGVPAAAPATPGERVPGGLPARVEAMLISSGRAVSPTRLAQALGLMPAAAPEAAGSSGGIAEASEVVVKSRRGSKNAAGDPLAAIQDAVKTLNRIYAETGRSFRVEQVAGGLRMMTLPNFGVDIASLHGATGESRLSRSAVETLAIIAYRQPVTRATLEAIRGVSCGETLKTLMDRRLVTIAGRAEELGRPMLYATTRQFLELFGLKSLKDLPSAEDLGPRG